MFKCRFCKYKDICLPEMESGLTKLEKEKQMVDELQKDYEALTRRLVELINKYKHLAK